MSIEVTIRYKKTTFTGYRSEKMTFPSDKELDEFVDNAGKDHSKEKIIGIG